ncbi:phosphatidylglycerol:prolipoprotein diacylglycerol transferase [Sphingomonas vulcanisoli]|uniref:Phosphatidylglycerol--prolipoprotein diacylglyceryl transferase n=1 Tax=Sphingomonas vulcanisoli TaxID=1658060 RepID=A0ABX0TTC7_9SPHN|nr:prolipoprotein diacylglyceryl transferase [Sphingomonas vulcanisoli]NIJ08773.1 phosphatidylglycerol:prolipoprotein diacylglycerol transferase [Sphingomonas vulcanisoli]
MSLLALASLVTAAPGAGYTHFVNLGLSPVAFHVGPLQVRWYSLGYIGGILLGWWWLTRMLDQPGAPMAKRHADDFVFYLTLGIILGGRIGYVLFYDPWMLKDPLQAFRLWDGGMSFHGGAVGSLLAVFWVARRNGLSVLRFCDYSVCCAPFGLFFVRIANFINGELWGRITDVHWAIVFPGADAGPYPRHPSQLYEAALEGLLLFAVLNWLFWRTDARYKPGLLLGTFLLGYGLIRFALEFVREPDVQLGILPWGLSMGQTLSAPMVIAGVYFILTAYKRKVRIEPFTE